MTVAVLKEWLAKVETQDFASHKEVSQIKQRNKIMIETNTLLLVRRKILRLYRLAPSNRCT